MLKIYYLNYVDLAIALPDYTMILNINRFETYNYFILAISWL